MPLISQDDLAQESLEWWLKERPKPRPVRQRLGQWLMNRLKPSEVNPEIFYEEDDGLAHALFDEQYCEQ